MKGYVISKYPTFIKPIMEQWLKSGIETELHPSFDPANIGLCDFIWCDFATEDAIGIQRLVTPARKILRIHSFECYTDIIERINPKAWHAIIFVGTYMLAKCSNIWTGQGVTPGNLYLIPNYIDLERFANIPANKEKNNKVAFVGRADRVKGIGELHLIAQELPDYEFHVAGADPSLDVGDFFLHNQLDNIHFYGHVDNIPEFLKDKTYIINTSLRESFSVATVEAMLLGVKPLVRNWSGANFIYLTEYRWKSIADIKRMLNEPVNPIRYQEQALNNLKLDRVMSEINYLLRNEPRGLVMPSITVGIVQTRTKYINELMRSLTVQGYDIKIDILPNFEKDKSIGECFNELAERCTTDFILFMGDDDILAENYIQAVMDAYAKRQNAGSSIDGILTGCIMFDEHGNKTLSDSAPTGFWRPGFIKKYRFREDLARQVDTEFFERIQTSGEGTAVKFDWIVGYYYRQHDRNVSGNKFKGEQKNDSH